MAIPLDTGDRVAWTDADRGIAVAADPAWLRKGRRLTVAVWRGGRFSGHVVRVPAACLYRTPRLYAGHRRAADVRA
jgi:hypothetical protein